MGGRKSGSAGGRVWTDGPSRAPRSGSPRPPRRRTGVNPERLLSGFGWSDTIWRQGELAAQFKGKTVLLGVDDMDVFKGIELKLQVGWCVCVCVCVCVCERVLE